MFNSEILLKIKTTLTMILQKKKLNYLENCNKQIAPQQKHFSDRPLP